MSDNGSEGIETAFGGSAYHGWLIAEKKTDLCRKVMSEIITNLHFLFSPFSNFSHSHVG